MSRNALLAFILVAVVAGLSTGCVKKDEDASSTTVMKKEEATNLNKTDVAPPPPTGPTKEEVDAKFAPQIKGVLARLKKAVTDFDAGTGDEEMIFEYFTRLGEIGAPAAQSARDVLPFLDHKAIEVRAPALKCWGQIKGKSAQPELTKALADSDEKIRRAAIEGWQAGKITEYGPIVDRLLKEVDADTAAVAMIYLKEQKLDDATVVRIAAKADEFEGAAAKQVLPFVVKNRAVIPTFGEIILKLVNHRDSEVRQLAVEQIYENDIKSYAVARRLVLNLADDDDLGVRGKSWQVLRRWAGNDAPEYDPEADEADLKKMRDEWKVWLEDNKAKLGQ